MAAWMLHAVCCGEEAGARNLVFFRVKWLQPAMEGTSCVRRLRLRSLGSFYVFCNNGCSCVRSSMRFFWSRGCRSHWNGCVKVAWCRGCMHNTIVFCSWRLLIVLEWLHPGCDSDLSANFRNFGAPFKISLKKCFKIVFFLLWRRHPVLELQFPTPLRAVLLCFATQSLQIALSWLRQGCSVPRLHA